MKYLNDIIQFWAPHINQVPMWAWVASLFSLFLLWAWVNGRRRLNNLEIDVDRMRGDLRAMTMASVGVGGRVREIEKNQKQLTSINRTADNKTTTKKALPAEKVVEKSPAKVVAIRPAVDEYNSHPYDYAIQLARHGSNANEIMYQSGISQNEAKLIHMLHSTKAG